jgi:transposase-like protein
MSMAAPLVTDAMGSDAARQLTDRIRIAVDGTWQLIRDAYLGRAWVALGYANWDEYTEAEFGASRLRLPREERRESVASLRESGLSIRAIATGLGIDKNTVRSDLGQVGETHTPAPEPVFDPTPILPPHDDDWIAADPTTGEVVEPESVTVTEHTVTEKVKTVTGLDGKTYTAAPSAPRRSSLIDDARNAGWQLRKAIERLERIHQDDRFTKNKVEILAALQPHLDFAVETISGL